MVKRAKALVNERLDLVAMIGKYNTQIFSEHFSKEELEQVLEDEYQNKLMDLVEYAGNI